MSTKRAFSHRINYCPMNRFPYFFYDKKEKSFPCSSCLSCCDSMSLEMRTPVTHKNRYKFRPSSSCSSIRIPFANQQFTLFQLVLLFFLLLLGLNCPHMIMTQWALFTGIGTPSPYITWGAPVRTPPSVSG